MMRSTWKVGIHALNGACITDRIAFEIFPRVVIRALTQEKHSIIKVWNTTPYMRDT